MERLANVQFIPYLVEPKHAVKGFVRKHMLLKSRNLLDMLSRPEKE